MTTRTRIGIAAGTAGLLGGLALGVTGIASADEQRPGPQLRDGAGPHMRDGAGPHMRDGAGPLHDGMAGRMERGQRGGGGLVSAVDADSLTIRTPDGTTTFALNSSTTYYEGPTKATRDAVDVGDVVHVRAVDPRATSPVAGVVVVRLAHVAGWVTGVDGSTLTLKDMDGFTRTVRTSGSTDWYDDGDEATSSIAKVGTFVRAHGTVAADGTTLQATRVATGTPARGQGAPAA